MLDDCARKLKCKYMPLHSGSGRKPITLTHFGYMDAEVIRRDNIEEYIYALARDANAKDTSFFIR